MSLETERGLTKLIWKIENFSCFDKAVLKSPSFTSRSGVSWKVEIYPNNGENHGEKNGETSMLIILQQMDLKEASLTCSIAFLDSNGTPLMWRQHSCSVPTLEEVPTITDVYYYNLQIPPRKHQSTIQFGLVKSTDMYGSRKSNFLPNGVLTVECRIWENGLPSENLNVFARTRIENKTLVVKKRFDLHVRNAGSLQSGVILEHVEPITVYGDNISVRLELLTSQVIRGRITSSLEDLLVKGEMYVLSSFGKKTMFIDIECKFDELLKEHFFDTNITDIVLKSYENHFLSNNVLSFVCEFTVGYNISFNRLIQQDENFSFNTGHIGLPVCQNVASAPKATVESDDTPPPTAQEPPNDVSGVVKDIYKKAYLSDFRLRVQDKTFNVHKNILGSRSSVFDAMFTADMKEKEDNSVEITDFDANTIQKMLDYVYTDHVDKGLDWKEHSELYSAADKYDLRQLKKTCSKLIEDGLAASNVLEVLKLADMHQDQELKDTVLDYISQHDNDIVGTESWREFLEGHAQLALEAFQSLYLKKMNQ